MVQIFACLRSPTKNASPTSCSAKTAELCNFHPSLHLCTISLTSLWKGTLWMSKSAPFWYFCISFRACIPHCIFLCFSTFSSLIIFNCLSFLSFILCALFWFSSLNFFISANFLSPASLALSFFAFSFNTLTVLAISNNGRWTWFSPYIVLQTLFLLHQNEFKNEIHELEFKQSTLQLVNKINHLEYL